MSGLPYTGAGLAMLISVMALAFLLVGAFLVWNPLGRQRHRLVADDQGGIEYE